MTDYTVQAGDTLAKIAKAHGMTVSELAKQNGIKDANKIEVGQELSLGKTTETMTKPRSESTIGLDSFEKQTPQEANTYSPLTYAAGGAMAYGMGQKVVPYMTDKAKTTYTSAKSGTAKAYAKMKGTAKQNAKAVKDFVAQKAKHAAKSAELHYAFGKDAVKQGVQKEKTAVKNTVQKAKTTAQNVATKTKTIAGNAVQKAKVGGRYTRFIANTKVAPKLIKGASKCAGPLAVLYGIYEVGTAYQEGGGKAAIKQAAKTGAGLAGGLAGAKFGATIGSIAGPIGAAVGGAIGGICGYLFGEKMFS